MTNGMTPEIARSPGLIPVTELGSLERELISRHTGEVIATLDGVNGEAARVLNGPEYIELPKGVTDSGEDSTEVIPVASTRVDSLISPEPITKKFSPWERVRYNRITNRLAGTKEFVKTPKGKLTATGLAVLFAVGGVACAKSTASESTPAATNDPAECAPQSNADVIFYAEKAPVGSNHFGPEADSSSPENSFTDFMKRICDPETDKGDTALLTASMIYAMGEPAGSIEDRDETIEEYGQDPDQWRADYEALREYFEKGNMSIEKLSGSYWTQYQKMVDGKARIFQAQESMTEKLVLRIDVPQEDGSTITYRFKLDCGFQPVQLEKFENIPVIKRTRTVEREVKKICVNCGKEECKRDCKPREECRVDCKPDDECKKDCKPPEDKGKRDDMLVGGGGKLPVDNSLGDGDQWGGVDSDSPVLRPGVSEHAEEIRQPQESSQVDDDDRPSSERDNRPSAVTGDVDSEPTTPAVQVPGTNNETGKGSVSTDF